MKALVIYRTLLYYIGVVNEQYLTYKKQKQNVFIYKYWKGGLYDSGN